MPKKHQQRRQGTAQPKRISWRPSANPALTEAILAVVDQQMLVALGYGPGDARRLMWNVVAQEIFAVMQQGQIYNEQRYIAALQSVPCWTWNKTFAPRSWRPGIAQT
jgi:hypothetical protein